MAENTRKSTPAESVKNCPKKVLKNLQVETPQNFLRRAGPPVL